MIEFKPLRINRDARDVFMFDKLTINAHQQMYDKEGNRVFRDDIATASEFNARVAFVVFGMGEILCKNGGEWGFVRFLDQNCEEHVPVFVQNFEMRDDGVIWLLLGWLKSDKDLLQSTHQLRDIRDYMLNENWDLPLHSYLCSLRTQDESKPMHMPAYTRSYTELKRWSKGRLHHDIGSWTAGQTKTDFAAVDIYDALEFYHIAPNMIWRSRLGTHLWKKFILPALAEKDNLSLAFAEDLINCTQLKVVSNESIELQTTCRLCQEHEPSDIVECLPHDIASVHHSCIPIMQLLVDIGNFARDIRKHESFSPECLSLTHSFLLTIANTQHKTNKIQTRERLAHCI